MELVKSQYYDFGPKFASEKLFELHGLKINRETLRQWMIEQELWQGKRRKQARIHQSRERRARFGELVQIDGSPHDWFEGRAPKYCLLLMVDDATIELMTGRFEEAENSLGYMRCIYDYIKLYGKPLAYYSDKHSIFKTSRRDYVDSVMRDTQVHRALKALKIELICANSPQAKGRVERANGILQDRLIKEMRLLNISTIEAGNEYLKTFIKDYNKKFAVKAQNGEDAHRPYYGKDLDLLLTLSMQTTRTISKNLECSYNNQILQIQRVGKGYRLRGSEVKIHETIKGETIIMKVQEKLEYKVLVPQVGPKEADFKDINLVIDKLIVSQNNNYSQNSIYEKAALAN
jgi:hypothetical protein